MRYQNPSIRRRCGFGRQGRDEVLVIPLFPHYAMSSYETAVERVKEVAAPAAPRMAEGRSRPSSTQPDYIAALAGSAADYLQPGFDHLLFSFHGLPERHLRKSDPTGCHAWRPKIAANGQPGPRHLLPRAVLQDRGRLCQAGRRDREILRGFPVAAGPRSLAEGPTPTRSWPRCRSGG